MNKSRQYAAASLKTADNLRSMARSSQDVSQLSLPEIDALVDGVAQATPAGNVPGVILNGLARLSGRRPPQKQVKRDVNLLFKGVERALDKAVYGAFFAGPAAIIWGYQNLLKLAGKDLEGAFPEGVWQFYVEYALREDTARHTNETHGFDTTLAGHKIELSRVNRLTAWVMTAASLLHQYDDLLANEWRERTYLHHLEQVTAELPDADHYAGLYREWRQKRPFGRGQDANPQHDYATYRRRAFDRFMAEAITDLSLEKRGEWRGRVQAAREEQAAYRRQLSILAYLDPDAYGETRVPIPLSQTHVGVIYQGRYYLFPISERGGKRLISVEEVRRQIAALLALPTGTSAVRLTALATMKRAASADLRRSLNDTLSRGLDRLRLAPILINADQRSPHAPLAQIRRGERGVGDHALTIFDTGETMVFDQSHIFFDGAWGAAFAEIFTREAIAWAAYLHTLPAAQAAPAGPRPLSLPFETSEQRFIEQAPAVSEAVSAETEAVNLQLLLTTRQLFRRRNDLIYLTVNDLLILYRAIHALTYRPDPNLLAILEQLGRNRRQETAAKQALQALRSTGEKNPAILIPIDASRRVPRERIYPLVFTPPLHELDLLSLHDRTLKALSTYKEESGDRDAAYAEFDRLQREYLAALAGFGQVLSRAKEVATRGESASAGSIKMLAKMPTAVQRLLDQIPNRFEVLNDLIKGREVFSNVGAVVPGSTLRRFNTAKDDNEKKTLVWGVLSDADGVMHISLRDFRPHVAALSAVGQRQVAGEIAQHYLDTYAHGLNEYLRDLRRITMASRETRMAT